MPAGNDVFTAIKDPKVTQASNLSSATCCGPQRRFSRLCLVFLVLNPVLFSGCSSAVSDKTTDDEPAAAAAPAQPPALVRVREVRREQIAPQLMAVGTVRPRHFSIIASAADGVVDEFAQEQGDFVPAGTVLSRLRMFSTDLALDEQRAVLEERSAQYQLILEPRQEDIDEAKAQQLAAEAAFSNAERRLKELRSLASRGATNPSAVEDAEDIFNETYQRLLAAKAVAERVTSGSRVEEKLQAKARMTAQEKHVAYLEAEKEKRITRAPFDGFIIREHTYLGQWLSKGDPVVVMAQLDEVDVEVPVDQNFISQISIGDSVTLKIQGVPNPDDPLGHWNGTVRAMVPRSEWETGSRSFPVIVRIANPMTGPAEKPVPALREGMMVEVVFAGRPFEATLVPKDSLVRTSRGSFVLALNPSEAEKPDSVRQVMVEPGISKAEWIQVIGTDLEPGMRVVTEGAERLRPFQSVQILPETASE